MLNYQRVYPINFPLNHYKIPLNHYKSPLNIIVFGLIRYVKNRWFHRIQTGPSWFQEIPPCMAVTWPCATMADGGYILYTVRYVPSGVAVYIIYVYVYIYIIIYTLEEYMYNTVYIYIYMYYIYIHILYEYKSKSSSHWECHGLLIIIKAMKPCGAGHGYRDFTRVKGVLGR